MIKQVTVQIIDPKHVHFGERGVIEADADGNVETIMVGKTQMYRVQALDCPHGVSAFFAEKESLMLDPDSEANP